MADTAITFTDYTDWLGEVKSRIRSARVNAARAANRKLILLYWDIGHAIVEKQEKLGWGKSVVETLSRDLQAEFIGMTGLSSDNLWRMRQLYKEYSSPVFLSEALQEFRRGGIAEFLEQAVPEFRDQTTRESLEQPVPEQLMQAVREFGGSAGPPDKNKLRG